jgi:hypothetical protein
MMWIIIVRGGGGAVANLSSIATSLKRCGAALIFPRGSGHPSNAEA